MHAISLYPLRFEPLYQYRPWGGRRLGHLLAAPLPADEPIGEAWLLSDRDDYPSRVADGPLRGKTIAELAVRSPDELLGNVWGRFERFPLLLKFLDVNEPLSVQVHPSDTDASLIPTGETGKTEAWVVMENGPGARIFAGLKRTLTAQEMRQAIASGTVAHELAEILPTPGDAILICAGTVHSLADVVVLEIQQNSDVTFRLYDWDHIDPKTAQRRPLQVDQALACMDFAKQAVQPVTPRMIERRPVLREKLFQCDQFAATRCSGHIPFIVGKAETPRVLVCLAGNGHLEYAGHIYPFRRGEVLLLPAVVGACLCRPHGTISMLEISLPRRL